MSENSTSPEELFGGEWESYGAGRTLVGVDSTQTEFETVGLTGGEKAHNHTLNGTGYAMITAGTKLFMNHSNNHNWRTTWEATGFSSQAASTVTRQDLTNLTGTTGVSSNLQPYITVYMWKRIS